MHGSSIMRTPSVSVHPHVPSSKTCTRKSDNCFCRIFYVRHRLFNRQWWTFHSIRVRKTVECHLYRVSVVEQTSWSVFLAIASSKSVQFPVHSISLLHRTDDDDDDKTSIHVLYQLPIGSTLPPIGSNPSNGIHFELEEFFLRLNLYPSKSSYEQKRDKFDRLSSSFAQIFNSDTLRRFTPALLPYGSYRLVCLYAMDECNIYSSFSPRVWMETISTQSSSSSEQSTSETKTSLDQTLLQFRFDQPAFIAHVSSLLEQQIQQNFRDEILYCRKLQALFPIISVLFNDQTRVEIFVQIKMQSMPETDDVTCRSERTLLTDFHLPIHGVRDV